MRTIAARWTCVMLAALGSAVYARAGHAQAPEGSDRLSPVAISESLTVLHTLDVSLRSNSKDAAVWYHRGMVAWALYERSRHAPPPNGLDWTTLVPLADTSLRRALEIEPANEQYFVAVARYLIASGASFRSYGAFGVFDASLEHARAGGDAAEIAHAALEASKLYWLQYDRAVCHKLVGRSPIASAHLTSGDLAPIGALAPAPFVEGMPPQFHKGLAGLLDQNLYAAIDYGGEFEYLKTELLLREAYNAAPGDPRTFRQFAMLLADHARWQEVASLAHSHIETARNDGWAWMALGLATHRLGNGKVALASFDTAFAVFGDSVRHLLDRVERVLSPEARPMYARGNDSTRKVIAATYWRDADPLWSVDGNKPRTEFLARIAFAQLRWGSEDMGLDGVTSDFGTMYVRTGHWAKLEPPRADDSRMDNCVPQVKAWYYVGDTTVLPGPAASWANLTHLRIETIPTQIARFRGTADSTDVLFASVAPIAAIAKAAQVAGPVRTDFWVVKGGLTDVARDSVRATKPEGQSFVLRLASGSYQFRTEASADGSLLAARGTSRFVAGNDARTGFSLTGFGMSDFVVASAVSAPARSGRRWTAFDVMPSVGPIAPNTQISLLWENYEFGDDHGSARYGVSITIQREEGAQSAAGKITAAIASKIAGAVGVTRTSDKVQYTFERTAPYAAQFADNVAIALGKMPSGNYQLTLRVTDRVSGAVAERSQRLTVPAPPPAAPCLYCRR